VDVAVDNPDNADNGGYRAAMSPVDGAVVKVRGEFIVGTPKTNAGARDVAIPPQLMPAVKAHLDEHTAPGKDSLLFPARQGEHMATATLYKVWYPARAAAGRPDLRWHDLRHTGAVVARSIRAIALTRPPCPIRSGRARTSVGPRAESGRSGRPLSRESCLERSVTDCGDGCIGGVHYAAARQR